MKKKFTALLLSGISALGVIAFTAYPTSESEPRQESTEQTDETVTVESAGYYAGTIASPNASEVQESLYSFELDFAEAAGTIKAGNAASEMYVYDYVKGEWVLYSGMSSEVVTDETSGKTTATVSLPYYPVETSGKYKVVISKGAFEFTHDDGTTYLSSKIEAEYTVKSDVKPYNYTVTPAEGDVYSIDEINFTFDGVSAYIWSPQEVGVVALDAEGNELGRTALTFGYDDKWNVVFNIDFATPITQLGECRVIVGSGLFDTNSDGIDDNESFEFNYNIVKDNSISSIEVEGNFNIYSVNGILVKRNAVKEDLNTLSPGIYIVNGKKIMVK